jgi:hypothetical protein
MYTPRFTEDLAGLAASAHSRTSIIDGISPLISLVLEDAAF